MNILDPEIYLESWMKDSWVYSQYKYLYTSL